MARLEGVKKIFKTGNRIELVVRKNLSKAVMQKLEDYYSMNERLIVTITF